LKINYLAGKEETEIEGLNERQAKPGKCGKIKTAFASGTGGLKRTSEILNKQRLQKAD